jgi:ATP-dependent helicase/nuclease subunit B
MKDNMKEKAAVYTIESGQSFADALAQGLLERTENDPLSLTDYTILLPTRRAARTLRDAFLRLSEGRPLMLPRMHPIGEVDADEMALMLAGESGFMQQLDLPPAVTPLERQLLLARVIQRANPHQSFDQSAALAIDLGRFLDEVQGEDLRFDGLSALVPERFAGHWQKTLEFLFLNLKMLKVQVLLDV